MGERNAVFSCLQNASRKGDLEKFLIEMCGTAICVS